DVGIVEVDLRSFHLGLSGLYLGLETALVGNRGVIGRLLAGGSAEQDPRPFGGQFGVLKRRLQLRDLSLLCCKISLKRASFELIELISLLDLRAFFEQPLFKERGVSRDHVHPIDRLHPSKKFAALGNRPLSCLNDTHRGWTAWGRLRPAWHDCRD